jgi:cell division protein FtsI/penicillin-binding protein 2
VGAAEPNGARATLQDRNGRILAMDVPGYDLYVEPHQVPVQRRDETREALLAALPRIPGERIAEAFASGRRTLLATGLTIDEKTAVHELCHAGVDFVDAPRRWGPPRPI